MVQNCKASFELISTYGLVFLKNVIDRLRLGNLWEWGDRVRGYGRYRKEVGENSLFTKNPV